MIADISPDPKALYEFLMVTGFLLSIAVNGAVFFNSRRAQKREVSFSAEFATKEEIDSIRRDIAEFKHDAEDSRRRLYVEVKELRLELKGDLSSGLEGVHERINDVLAAVAEVKGKISR